jgi:hypothetical protein
MNKGIINWDEERVVFFFGAGASKAEGLSITNELLKEALNSSTGSRKKKVNEVKEYLKTTYQGDLDKFGVPTFEEILGPIDIALQKQENLSSKWNLKELSILRDDLIYCICKALDEKLQPSSKYHDDFIDKLLGRYPERWNKCSFISLNYDILLDNALTTLGDADSSAIDLDYGINFRNEKEIDYEKDLHEENYWHVPGERKIFLLKLHGSLNWIYCSTCNTIKITPKSSEGVLKIYTQSETCDSDFCSSGTSEQRLIIVPPAYTKAYDNPYLVSIWLQAEKILQKATRVYFIGYSMPEADIHIQYLLKKSLFRQDGNRPHIIVVNPDVKNGTTERYQRLFGEVEYLPIGFEEFSSKLEDYFLAEDKSDMEETKKKNNKMFMPYYYG